MVISQLNNKLVSQFGGWIENQVPIPHRYTCNPYLLYGEVDTITRLELSGLLDSIQFNFDGVWYCLEKASKPEDDMWGIGFGELVKYITYRVKYLSKWSDCSSCLIDSGYCDIHRHGLRSYHPGKELKELMTHEDWCNTIMTILRKSF